MSHLSENTRSLPSENTGSRTCPSAFKMAEPRSSGHATARFWKHDMQMGVTLVYNPDTVMLNHVHKQLVFCVLGKDAVQGNCLEESKHLVFQKLQAWATITYRNAKGSETFELTSSEDYG
eukprot:gene16854-biopygen25771